MESVAFDGWVVDVAPGRSVAIAVSIVVRYDECLLARRRWESSVSPTLLATVAAGSTAWPRVDQTSDTAPRQHRRRPQMRGGRLGPQYSERGNE